MTVGLYFDRTQATRERPAAQDIANDGTFTDTDPATLSIKVHASRPKADIVLPGGVRLEKSDYQVNCDLALDIKEGDFLVFWGRRYEVIVELNRYDILASAVQHNRRSFLVREMSRTP